MQGTDTSNHHFQLAVRFVNQTNRPLFLTGKAGTGKTTFLRHIQQTSFKKMAVVAPTGVAAINAGGVTMHSFFQLPFGPFVPGGRAGWNSGSAQVTDQHSLLKNIRFNQAKRELLRELDLLIIDEVSMVRADMLDAVDAILRHFRHQPTKPFGGLQVLFIGDLFQLPPVVNQEEWDSVLRAHYKSPFFFDAHALAGNPPVYLELKKIYRQNEATFIDILNNLRNNTVSATDLEVLHRRYFPGFEPEEGKHYITLTSHNAKADTINESQLNKLPGKLYEFKGEIKGDFSEKALPAEMTLQLKEGSQIMFTKNDKGEVRRFFNGKIATIESIAGDKIIIRFPTEDTTMELEKETWRNIRYSFNREKDVVEEEELGTYTQYPIRLAWAITIHKSQGLTFDKAIVDAGASFAPGQVYVALSRLTSMEGLVLYSRIQPHAISTDERVLAFTRSELAEDELQRTLQAESKGFISRSILQCFDWSKVVAVMEADYEAYETRQVPDKNAAILWANALLEKVKHQQIVANKFVRQLEMLLSEVDQKGYTPLLERIQAATDYFLKELDEVTGSLGEQIEKVRVKPRVKKYIQELKDLLLIFQRKRQALEQVLAIANALAGGADTNAVLHLLEEQQKAVVVASAEPEAEAVGQPSKAKKGETKMISLEMFKEGKRIPEIAQLRGMAESTIETHITSFVFSGEVDVHELVTAEKITAIMAVLEETNSVYSAPVKEKLGEDYTYSEIHAVIQYRNRLQQTTS